MSALCGTPTSRSAGTEKAAQTTNMNLDMVPEPEHGGLGRVLGMVRRMESASRRRRSRRAELGCSSHAASWRTPRRWGALKAAPYVITACMLLNDVAIFAAADAQPYPEARMNISTTRFDFRHFESLPKDRGVEEAQAEVERLFPPGSKADDFEPYFEASGAKCTRAADSHGPFVGCIYSMSGLLVTTDWTVGARLDLTLSTITTVRVTRYLTGF
jgi:hypothetical protein